MSANIEQLVRRMFAAFVAGDRATVEEILAEDFHFTSPYDDAIDRAEYFRRCWPNHDRMRSIDVHRVVGDGDTAFVAYEVRFKDGRHAHNVEVMTFRDDKLVNVFVHFGATRDAQHQFVYMAP